LGTTCADAGGVKCDGKGTCVADHCLDALSDGDETDVDCGGACPPCDDGRVCKQNKDCANGACLPVPNSPNVLACAPCSDDPDCDTDRYCDSVKKACVPDKKNGEACGTANECPGNYCVDGVCCESPCDTGCAACSVKQGSTEDGTCTYKAIKKADDLGACDATSGGCNGDCQCDPLGDCSLRPKVISVALGYDFSCALFANGTVKCWGGNTSGQLGKGNTTPLGGSIGQLGPNLTAIDLGKGNQAKSIAVGAERACAVLGNGTLKCWGLNGSGQLGLGDTKNRGDKPGQMGDNLPAVDLGTGVKVVSVALDQYTSCALLDDATVKCWGYNVAGGLGLGYLGGNVGDAPNEMGDNLARVNLGTGAKATSLAGGNGFYCAKLDGGTAKCWGGNYAGQLGLGDTKDRGGKPEQMGDNLPALNFGTGRTVLDLSAGCARLDDGSLKCWGLNTSGVLGTGTNLNKGGNANDMGDNLPAIDLGIAMAAVPASGVWNTHCARLLGNAVKCWGANNVGQLGLGDTKARGDGPGEMGDALPVVPLGTGFNAIVVAVGEGHACAFDDGGRLKCWGKNNTGQLGLGDTKTRGAAPGEMGDNLPYVQVSDY